MTLIIKRKIFDLIISGEVKELYLAISSKLNNVKQIKLSPLTGQPGELVIECTGTKLGEGKTSWGAQWGKSYFILKLGRILNKNITPPKEQSYEDMRK